ncbi:MAG: hypothetical protein M1158_01845 [Candidatus Marsarchaeota archaeon]|nr:hypothetical protein [Candidatus Marsarchaeota archaeon]
MTSLINEMFEAAKDTFLNIYSLPSEAKLRRDNKEKLDRFSYLCKEYSNIVSEIGDLGKYENFLTPFWQHHDREQQKKALTSDFMRYRDVDWGWWYCGMLGVPYIGSTHAMLRYMAHRMSDTALKQLLKEDFVGSPFIISHRYQTSFYRIQNLFHFVRYTEYGKNLDDFHSVVDWGGGFGEAATIFRRINSTCTYTLIDIPSNAALQYCYLSAIWGRNYVNLVTKKNGTKKGKINIIALGMLDYADISADLFISTFALNESTQAALNYVYRRNFFGAKNFLFGIEWNVSANSNSSRIVIQMQKFTNTEKVPMQFRSDVSWYLFR